MRRVSGGTHPELNLGVKVWITFKSSFNANILLGVIQEIFALELQLKEIYGFAQSFNPGYIPSETNSTQGPRLDIT